VHLQTDDSVANVIDGAGFVGIDNFILGFEFLENDKFRFMLDGKILFVGNGIVVVNGRFQFIYERVNSACSISLTQAGITSPSASIRAMYLGRLSPAPQFERSLRGGCSPAQGAVDVQNII
jgi:hypothetical protein